GLLRPFLAQRLGGLRRLVGGLAFVLLVLAVLGRHRERLGGAADGLLLLLQGGQTLGQGLAGVLAVHLDAGAPAEALLEVGRLAGRLTRVLRQAGALVQLPGQLVEVAGRFVLAARGVLGVALAERLGRLLRVFGVQGLPLGGPGGASGVAG